MGGMNRRNFIKNIAITGAVLGLGNVVFNKPSEALAGEQQDEEEILDSERKPEIIASCHCKKVVLRIINMNPRFSVCHCDTCQLIHNGPWYGADCGNIKVINGKEHVSNFPVEHGEIDKGSNQQKSWTAWNFCSHCGSRLFYSKDDKESKKVNDSFNVSVGLLHLICPKDMTMENELFYEMKPDYYSFHETKKFSSDDIIKKI